MDRAPLGSDVYRSFAKLKRHVDALVRLAGPIVVARSGVILMATVDVVMTGHYDSQQLAYLSIGLALVMPMMVGGLGLLMGTLVISANRFGAGDYPACGQAWRYSLPYAFGLGFASAVVSLFGESLLALLGQSQELAAHGGDVMMVIGLGLPVYLVYLTTAFFMEGINKPVPGMIAMLGANVVNALLNWVFIFGKLGVPEMGAVGAAWATTASRCIIAVALITYVWTMKEQVIFGVRVRPPGGWRAWAQQRWIGYGVGTSIGVETSSFAAVNMFAGWLGPLPLAAYSIAFNLLAMVFMVALGLGAATSVRVSVAHGRNDLSDLRLAGWTGLGVNTLTMIAFGLLFLFAAEPLTRIFTNDPALMVITAPLVAFMAYLPIVDGGQAVMANALRGRQDVWIPSAMQSFAFFGVMVPAVYLFVFPGGQGAIGLLQGVLLGTSVSFILLTWRFHRLARHSFLH